MTLKNVYYLLDLRHGNVVYDISLNPLFLKNIVIIYVQHIMLGLTSIKLAVMKMMTVSYKEKIFS